VKSILKASVHRLGYLPGVLSIRRLWYARQFRNWPGAYSGVYSSFAEAARAAPSALPQGFDAPVMAGLYDHLLDRIWPCDYPTLWWLERALPEASCLFDFGGHVGVSFYGFSRYLPLPQGFRWIVCDVPAVIERGRQLAIERRATQLEFTADFKDASQAAVLHASGSLQFLEESLGSMLDRLERRPKHLLLNKLPLHDGRAFVTLQHTVHAYNPYRVFNRDEFLGDLEERGYELVDKWDDLDRSCVVPLHPEAAVTRYSGLYLRARP